jgi:hypothetical protein
MARIGMEEFEEGEEIVRVYLAAALPEAGDVQAALDAAGIEYGVEVESFASPTVLGSNAPRSGAGFWVLAADVDASLDALERAGLVRGLLDRSSR